LIFDVVSSTEKPYQKMQKDVAAHQIKAVKVAVSIHCCS